MSAISVALDKVVAKATKVASRCMEVPESSVDFQNGVFSARGTNKFMPFGDVSLQAYIAHKFDSAEIEPGLKETSFYDPKNFTFPSGVHIARSKSIRKPGHAYRALDSGRRFRSRHQSDDRRRPGAWRNRARHRPGDAGANVYDGSGQLVTASYMDYCMPRATICLRSAST